MVGKFAGHLCILTLATVVGYGVAGLALAFVAGADPQALGAFALMVASSAMLGGVFLAIGTFVSALVKDRGAAAGIAIGVWLLFRAALRHGVSLERWWPTRGERSRQARSM